MFEDFLSDPKYSNSKKKHKQLQRLLLKYIEVQKFQEIISNKDLPLKQRQRLNKAKTKKKILRKIHEELNERLRPEETFEIWHLYKNLNLDRQKSSKKHSVQSQGSITEGLMDELVKSNENDEVDSDDSDNELSVDNQLDRFLNSFDLSSTWTKANFLIKTKGLEVLPHAPLETDSSGFIKSDNASLINHHINNLKTLLHINILRRNWGLAYKIFCLLIRLPKVDIRSLWPLGIEILNRQREETAYDSSDIKLFKDEKFFDWLSSFFIINKHSNTFSLSNTRKISAPIWRSGSRTHTPMYVITSLWGLMIKNKYARLRDKLDELLLEPPYNTDGVFYFLMALCKLLENFKLANRFSGFDDESPRDESDNEYEENDIFFLSKTDIHKRILENQKIIEKNLEKCKEFNFDFPKDLINNEINWIMKQINEDNNDNSSISSTSERNFDNESDIQDRNISSTPLDVEPIFEYIDGKSKSRQNSIDLYENKLSIEGTEDNSRNDNLEENNLSMNFDFDFD
mmetsp:Transcript_379/g.351  ORF Transcript_379/g.351 Transcript_379/m.351 type:complete len:514 (+) Transcript_379:125-1666(+)